MLGIVAGVFAVFALIYLLHALSWGLWEVIGSDTNFWLGFLITGVLILILGAIAGFIAHAHDQEGHAAQAGAGDRGGAADQGAR